MARALRCTH